MIPVPVKQHPRWAPLSRELGHWAEAGRRAELWLRDDDAVTVTPALERLVKLCETYRVPALVAVIPTEAKDELAAFLTAKPLFHVAVHGFSHKNHAPAGAKKQEFPLGRNRDQVEVELGKGRLRLQALFGAKRTEIFVPPWNRLDADVAARLPKCGFRALSALGREPLLPSPAPLIEINVQLDIIDWRGNRGGHGLECLADQLAAQLAWARKNDWRAVGILTHHLVHDETAWRFLEELFAWTASHASVLWTGASELIHSRDRS
jgi:peptidoglycan/xylan/chitin deacetylase (PgdA/CDA1 family)